MTEPTAQPKTAPQIRVHVCHVCKLAVWLVVEIDGQLYRRCGNCHLRQGMAPQARPFGALLNADDRGAPARPALPEEYRLLLDALEQATHELNELQANHPGAFS